MRNILIVGGTSGLGLILAQKLKADSAVCITGRKKIEEAGLHWLEAELGNDTMLPKVLNTIVESLPELDLVIYAAGFYQEGFLHELTDEAIMQMDSVSVRAPAMLLARILRKQEKLPGFMAITSSSQWKPRAKEPIYASTKAALGMLADSLAEDPQVGKVLHAAPGGMQTPFWDNTGKDSSSMLDPKWIAEEVLKSWQDDYSYRYIRFNRDPQEVVTVETR